MTKLAVAVSAKDHRQGDKDAPCTLVEYGDYQCPSCGQAYPIVKRLQKHFGKRLSFVFRNFPLTQIHRYAEPAAETAEFAGAHEKFWQMHDLLYENQDRLDDELLVELPRRCICPGSVASGPGDERVSAPCACRFYRRSAQRRQRNPELFHERAKARWLV